MKMEMTIYVDDHEDDDDNCDNDDGGDGQEYIWKAGVPGIQDTDT